MESVIAENLPDADQADTEHKMNDHLDITAKMLTNLVKSVEELKRDF